jgi:hypothetical protein
MPMTLTRSLLTILIPGLVAIAPWLLILVQHTPATLGFDKYVVLANALVFASAATVGSIFESIGTGAEVEWDKELEAEFAVEENWYAYLAKSFEKEPVGYRYLSRLVTSLYFELSMRIAVPVFVFGACILACLRFQDLLVLIAVASLAIAVILGRYFHRQARHTHRVICETRLEFNKRTSPIGA